MATLKEIASDSKASQGTEELYWLLNKLSKIKPKVILEVGVHLGYSLKVWQESFEPEVLIGIENEMNDTLRDVLHQANDNGANWSIITHDSHLPISLEQVKSLLPKDRKIDFLFLDGDHTLAGVKQDYEMYAPLVRSGGIIAFHDAAIQDHPLVDVYKLLRTIKWHIEVYQSDANGVAVLYV